ncbi:HD domain-containing protein [Rhizobium leguminosarum]|uniref:HD domain-containing protein n=1 Tax=Rhizobium leguminosarum TaxID=384 RepID=UPI001C945735|nr:HD domain-containing protein [Rhizobium leguminosarum]MBY5798191.1 HD domain-containing protein [Rhizobium leguminosarum]
MRESRFSSKPEAEESHPVKPQRIRDPLHDLIEFDVGDFDQGLWGLINTPEFQRLRHIKQLGFSELVYPGATHSRLLHSVGVFQTARQLSQIIKSRLSTQFNSDRSNVALIAALVHDVGHGPFSHAFESSLKQLDKLTGAKHENRHEIWTAEIIRGDTTLGSKLENFFGKEIREAVATLLLQETPTDIYSAIVSSQFDADRLDYVRRDRMMTGAQHGGFDFSWLMANLEVDQVTFATDGETYATVDTLVLGSKAFQAAESYVLGLFHLYFAVYFHKTTRSAEKMLTAILVRLGQLILDGATEKSGLPKEHPMVQFIKGRDLTSYLRLDDTVIWGCLPFLENAPDEVISSLAKRLHHRELYKAIDVSERFDADEASKAKFRMKLAEAKAGGEFDEFDFFEDTASRNPYKRRGYDTPEALSKVLIRTSSNSYEDLAARSKVVEALKEKTVYRVYARDSDIYNKIKGILGD